MNSLKKEMNTQLIYMIKKLFNKKKKLYYAIVVGCIVGCIIAYSIPPKYTVTVSLSPESGQSSNGNLGYITSMLGINSLEASSEALNVSLFPEIIKSTPFILEMLEIKIRTEKNDSLINLSNYIKDLKSPWWNTVLGLPSKILTSIKKASSTEFQEQEKEKSNPLYLTPDEYGNIQLLKTCLNAETDKKTNITLITVTLQDPVTAAITADSAMAKLQTYITEYRAKKATEDCIYLKRLYDERKKEYHIAQKNYASFSDANRNIIQQMVQSETERLRNEKDLAYQVYSQIATQLQIAQAKVQEAKPVFAVVEPATVPLFPSSPKKMMILVVFVFLAVVVESAWILFGEDLWKSVKAEMKKPKE